MKDQFIQNWNSTVFDSSKALNYRIFKTKFEFEEYFNILNSTDAKKFCRFRTTNHHLPVETGRWNNIEIKDRICNLCNSNKIGDEFHYILECTALSDKRKELLPKYYLKAQNTVKFNQIMSCKKINLLRKLCRFIKYINECTPG